MSNYNRVVSYVYRYNNGVKQENVGYARLEERFDKIKLYIGIRDSKGFDSTNYKIALLYLDNGIIKSIEISDVAMKKNIIDYSGSNIERILNDNNISIKDLEAIIIEYNNQVMYASELTDNNVLQNYLNQENMNKEHINLDEEEMPDQSMDLEKNIDNEEFIDKMQLNTEEVNGDNFEDTQNNVNLYTYREEDKLIPNSKDTDDVSAKSVEDNNIYEQVNEQIDEFEDNINVARDSSNMSKDNDLGNITETFNSVNETSNGGAEVGKESRERFFDDYEEFYKEIIQDSKRVNIVEKIIDSYPKLPRFNNNELMQCVRIVPKDIGLMDMDNWSLGNNSFLLHGYYNYKYLLLGYMLFQDGNKQAVVGVPGIYNNKEKYLANLFGFRQFIPVKRQNVKTGNYGYWITQIK